MKIIPHAHWTTLSQSGYVFQHGCFRSKKLQSLHQLGLKELLQNIPEIQKHVNHWNHDPILNSSVFAYFNPNGDLFLARQYISNPKQITLFKKQSATSSFHKSYKHTQTYVTGLDDSNLSLTELTQVATGLAFDSFIEMGVFTFPLPKWSILKSFVFLRNLNQLGQFYRKHTHTHTHTHTQQSITVFI